MYKGKTIGVVIPAYNEEEFIADVIHTVPSFVDRIYVINDCSTDGTWREILAQARRSNGTRLQSTDGGQTVLDLEPPSRPTPEEEGENRVVPINHPRNRGVGGAIKTGYLQARTDKIDVTAVMGGDGQMDPEQLTEIIDPVVEGKADYAKGNRLVSKRYMGGMSNWRIFGNLLLTALTRIASGYWDMVDPQDGYTAISLEALEAVNIEDMFEFYGYCNDLLVKLNIHDMRITDVPRQGIYGDETSHIEYSSYIPRVSLMLLRNFASRILHKYVIRGFHPISICFLVGFMTGLFSIYGGTKRAITRGTNSVGSNRDSKPVVNALFSMVAFLIGMGIDRLENDGLVVNDRVDDSDEDNRI